MQQIKETVLKMRVFVGGVKLWYTRSSELYMVILQHTSSAEHLDIEVSYVRVYEDQMRDQIQKVTFRVTYFMQGIVISIKRINIISNHVWKSYSI